MKTIILYIIRIITILLISVQAFAYTLKDYEGLLVELSKDEYKVVCLKDFDVTNCDDKIVVALRHDIDRDMEMAYRIAILEQAYKIKSSYYVLHTAKYYNDSMINALWKMQFIGHEIGWHNDLVTCSVLCNIPADRFLRTELNWLESNGINIVGTAAHGSKYCYERGFHNNYIWAGQDTIGNFNNLNICSKLDMNNYFKYEVYSLKADVYLSDCRGFIPSMFGEYELGTKIIILIHPCRVQDAKTQM